MLEKNSSSLAYFTSVITAVFGSITLTEVAMIVGIVTTIGTFYINWYYKSKEDARREKREAQ